MYIKRKVNRMPTYEELMVFFHPIFEKEDSVFKHEVIKDIIKNGTYFAAVKKTHIPSGRERVYCGMVLTKENPDPKNPTFEMEIIDEHELNIEYKLDSPIANEAPLCPLIILRMLTGECAGESSWWRHKSKLAYESKGVRI